MKRLSVMIGLEPIITERCWDRPKIARQLLENGVDKNVNQSFRCRDEKVI